MPKKQKKHHPKITTTTSDFIDFEMDSEKRKKQSWRRGDHHDIALAPFLWALLCQRDRVWVDLIRF